MANLVPLLWDEDTSSYIKIGENIGSKLIHSYDITSSTYIDTDADSSNSIKVTSNTADIKLMDIDIPELVSGYQSISFRLKSSKIDTANNIICLKAYKKITKVSSKILLSTAYIKANDFKAINTYENFGLVTNFSGGSANDKQLSIEVYVLANTAATVSLDYIEISPTFANTFGLATT